MGDMFRFQFKEDQSDSSLEEERGRERGGQEETRGCAVCSDVGPDRDSPGGGTGFSREGQIKDSRVEID